ncbi:hypothetical protein M407DRAFT_34989 [Tulasnella calospora MUT 4182]|uniref:Uncharacterized protein n=1 Tax=Tulasnella calospora MUT 4182 TaxID=1051891 RepID=A0A0C3PM91_9AGAM|nr:hypothetical protein M407DRAFT_34989 [Tulasnella calospora MUT 4182]
MAATNLVIVNSGAGAWGSQEYCTTTQPRVRFGDKQQEPNCGHNGLPAPRPLRPGSQTKGG